MIVFFELTSFSTFTILHKKDILDFSTIIVKLSHAKFDKQFLKLSWLIM